MAANKTRIANLALGHLGQSKPIADIEENTAPARAMNLFYEETLREVLRDFPWPFATKIEALALRATDPNEEWSYSYTYPTNCVYFRRIQSGFRVETREQRVPYRVGKGSPGLVIFTDKAEAIGEFTEFNDDPTHYPPDFTQAFSLKLAANTANMVCGEDPFKMGDKARAKYDNQLERARVNAGNEEQPDVPPEPESISARS